MSDNSNTDSDNSHRPPLRAYDIGIAGEKSRTTGAESGAQQRGCRSKVVLVGLKIWQRCIFHLP